MGRDLVMARLKERNNDSLEFVAAVPEVVEGYDLEATSGQYHGKSVYIANLGKPKIPKELLETGVMIRVGTGEECPGGVLECRRRGDEITVALYDKKGRALTRLLACKARGDEIDEGRLTWFGPMEDYGTPWSDSSPACCQVVTVEQLRKFTPEPKNKKTR